MRPPETLDPVVERELAELEAALAGDSRDAALLDLVAAVREERPVPPPDFERRMDSRARQHFAPVKTPRRRRRLRLGFGPSLALVASVLVALVVSFSVLRDTGDEFGGAASSTSVTEDAGGGTAERSASGDQAARETDSSAGSTAEPMPMPMPGIPPVPGEGSDSDRLENRKVERSASLVLAAPSERIAVVADRVVRVTDGLGGFVASSTVRADAAGGGDGTFELRVPVARLDRAMAELSRLAHVQERAQGSRDITVERASARERLIDARAERRALLRQLETAGTPRETSGIRRRLRVVNRQISWAKAAVRRVDNRAAFATISVLLVADDGAPGEGGVLDDGRWTPGDAVRDAVRVLEVAAGVALILLAVLVPVALLTAPGAVLWRRSVRRRREQALDAA